MRLILILIVLSITSCSRDIELVQSKKVVINKAVTKWGNQIALDDYNDFNASFGLYSSIELGDTIVFRHKKGDSFSKYNYVVCEIIKSKQ